MGKRSREKKERKSQVDSQVRTPVPKKISLEKIYFTIIEWGIYLALFNPLIVNKNYFCPNSVPKTIFFRIVVDVIFIAYILLVIANRQYLPKISALAISITVFFAVTTLASLTGINFMRSFWGVFERMTGLLTFFHLFIFFIILISVFHERKYWERLLTVSIIVGVLVTLYVLASIKPTNSGGGTLGNTSFLTGYLLFDIFLAIILLFTKPGWWKILYGSALLLMLKVLLFPSQAITKGAIGAFFGGIFVLGFGYLIFYLLYSKRKMSKILVPLLLIFIISAGIGVSRLDFFKAKLETLKQSSSWQSRVELWEIGLAGWRERPILGWGPENYNVVFAKYFNPAIPLTEDIWYWYDHAHNIVVDTLVDSGIMGFLSYLAIFGVAIWGLLRMCPKVVEKKNLLFPLGMGALLLVCFANNIWVFDMVSSHLMFFVSLAFINFLIETGKPEVMPATLKEKGGIAPFIGASLIVVAILSIYFGNIQPAQAARLINNGGKSMINFQKAVATAPMAVFEAPIEFYKAVISYANQQNHERALLEKAFNLSARELEKSIEKNPEDYLLYLTLGREYNDLYMKFPDKEKLDLADKFLKKAIELSPRNQIGYCNLAQTRLFQGRHDEAVQLFQKTIDLEPRYALSHWYLALSYKLIGRNDLAVKKVKDAERAGYDWRAKLGDLKSVIEILQNLQDSAGLVELYPLAIEKDPRNAQFWAGLAVAQSNLKRYKEARESTQRAMELKTDFAPQ